MPVLHPRRAKYARFWARQKERMARLAPGVISVQYAGADRPLWIDYFPWAIGTVPEKMVFTELAARDITFFFAPYWGDMPFTEDVYEHYRPDFILPEYRIVIEVYGTYWHTLPGATDKDARKAVMYESAGYRYYALWDYEILAGVSEALDRIPELVNPAIQTGRIFVSDRPFDPRSSLRAQRRKWPKVVRWRVAKVVPRGLATPPLAVQVPYLRAPRQPRAVRELGFRGFDPEYLAELGEYSQQWREYIDRLGEYFKYGRARRRRRHYPELYRYWTRWKDWWDVWQKAMQVGGSGAEYHQWQSWRRRAYRLRR